MICDKCENKVSKVISFGLPFYLCKHCSEIFGFWSFFYVHLCVPIENFFNDELFFFEYEGSYLKALWFWLKGDYSE